MSVEIRKYPIEYAILLKNLYNADNNHDDVITFLIEDDSLHKFISYEIYNSSVEEGENV